MNIYRLSVLVSTLCIYFAAQANAQMKAQYLDKVSTIIEKEGNLFIAINQPKPNADEVCLEENEISNQVQFKNDSMFVDYVNHTELFCEAYILRSHYQYQLDLKDIDPMDIRLVEKKYNYGKGKLAEGPDSWFEIHLFTKQQKNRIKKNDLESRDTELLTTVSLLFQTKEGAKSALISLKSALNATMSQ